jgi:GDP-mannose 6-dehydrogenase
MNVSVFGLGYVGCVTAACMAKTGNTVVGVELQPEKVAIVNSGAAPFMEPGLSDLIAEQVKRGALSATSDPDAAVLRTELSLICVGTPSLPSGQLDASALANVCAQIGKALRAKTDFHIVVVRSTVLPGTIESCIAVLERASGKTSGMDFAVAFNPEFLREGTALADFWDPPFTVIGADDPNVAKIVGKLYAGVDAPTLLTDTGVAQMVKYAANLYHATKIVFANELGRICKAAGVDSHKVMEIFCQDTKLNVSAAYLRPGYAYGGSCLPKDLHAITAFGRENHIPLPLLERVHESNRQQIELGIQTVLDTGKQTVGVLGFSFKPDTDDLRQSPHVALVEALIGKGRRVRVYDPYIQYSRLMGANRRFIDAAVPHVVDLFTESLDEVARNCECIVIANRDKRFEPVLDMVRDHQIVVDLVRLPNAPNRRGQYIGLAW